MSELLRLTQVSAGYGPAIVLDEVGFSLAEGKSLALLGRNGVGKTTLITTLLGLTTLHRGSLNFGGVDLTRLPTHARARAGLGWVPQERGVYPSLTVAEHLVAMARPGEWDRAKVYDLFPSLRARAKQRGDQLSGGEQQMLAIGRALVLNPRLLLLDEPMEGLAPVIVQHLIQVIQELRERSGLSMILVEQHARLALRSTDQVIVLERGRIVHRGTSAALLADEPLQRRLLAVG